MIIFFVPRGEKYNAVVNKVKELCHKGQPVLGRNYFCRGIRNFIKNVKDIAKISHNVLNAKQHEREADIVSRAGQKKCHHNFYKYGWKRNRYKTWRRE